MKNTESSFSFCLLNKGSSEKIQISVFIAFLDRFPTFMETGFVFARLRHFKRGTRLTPSYAERAGVSAFILTKVTHLILLITH